MEKEPVKITLVSHPLNYNYRSLYLLLSNQKIGYWVMEIEFTKHYDDKDKKVKNRELSRIYELIYDFASYLHTKEKTITQVTYFIKEKAPFQHQIEFLFENSLIKTIDWREFQNEILSSVDQIQYVEFNEISVVLTRILIIIVSIIFTFFTLSLK